MSTAISLIEWVGLKDGGTRTGKFPIFSAVYIYWHNDNNNNENAIHSSATMLCSGSYPGKALQRMNERTYLAYSISSLKVAEVPTFYICYS